MIGQLVTVDRLVRQDHAALAASGAIAADMESAPLLGRARTGAAVVLRAISGTPQHSVLGPSIVSGGIAALRSLRSHACADPLGCGEPARGRCCFASPRSFCAGVERAIEIVELALERYGAPVYVRKQIVHNLTVVADLERRGAVFVDELGEVPDGQRGVLRARGVAEVRGRRPGAA